MAMNLGSARGLKSEINVTPFVDVALVLLIIFMVVTPLLQRGKDVQLPKSHSADSARTDSDPVVVSITRDKQIWLNNEPHSEQSLVSALERQFALLPERRVVLKGDDSLSVRDVRRVLASLQRAGARGVTLGVREVRRE